MYTHPRAVYDTYRIRCGTRSYDHEYLAIDVGVSSFSLPFSLIRLKSSFWSLSCSQSVSSVVCHLFLCWFVSDGFIPIPGDGFIPIPGDGFIPILSDGFIPIPDDGFIPIPSDGFIPILSDGFIPIPNQKELSVQRKTQKCTLLA